MFRRIWGSSVDLNVYTPDVKEKGLLLGKVNFLIGTNNSGKSRFMRLLFSEQNNELKFLDLSMYEYFHSQLNKYLSLTKPKINAEFTLNSHVDKASLNDLDIETLDKAFTSDHHFGKTLKIYQLLIFFFVRGSLDGNLIKEAFGEDALLKSQQIIREGTPFDEIDIGSAEQLIPHKIYIPILRGLRPLNGSDNPKEILSQSDFKSNESYLKRTRRDYFSAVNLEKNNSKIFTGHDLYETFTKNLLGRPEGRQRVSEYQKKISEFFFEGKEVTIIPEHDQDQISIKIGESEQRPISQLGDGLQQVILITSAIYFQTAETLFFIEEPEISLHPWLLRRLAEFMIDESITGFNHQFIVTTHSNHLLDLAELNDDVTIYKFSKKKDAEQFEIKDAKGDREILLELGVHASSLYLANCSIWVEGLTDRWYIEFYMKKYLEYLEKEDPSRAAIYKNFALNHHYTFIEYGGGNVVHWDFGDDTRQDDIEAEEDLEKRLMHALRQTARALVIFDKDSLEKSERASEFETQLKENLYVYTEAKEIENLIPAEFIIKTAEKRLQSNRKDISKTIFNGEADKVDPNRFLKNEGIGSLLDDLLVEKGASDKTPYFAVKKSKKGDGEEAADIDKQAEDVQKNKTISRKSDFAKTAIAFMKSDFDPKNSAHMTAPIKELSEKIFTHIAASNPN